jgi:hypothetical protein
MDENKLPQETRDQRKDKVKHHVNFVLVALIAFLLLSGIAVLLTRNPLKLNKSGNPINSITDNSAKPPVEDSTEPVKAYDGVTNLSEVSNIADFNFSEEAGQLLQKNSFVVVPAMHNEFFSKYESNRYQVTPNFVTTDAVLHNYHLVFNHILKSLEQKQLFDLLKNLNTDMLSKSISQYEIAKGTDWENAAMRNVGFFAVGSKLLDGNISVPSYVATQVNREIALMEGHEGITNSPVMNIGSNPSFEDALKEDYSQYIPRGHYDQNEKLQSYFKAMMWYGRITFRLSNDDETKSAVLLTLALNNSNANQKWTKIFETINFFVGETDDINFYQYRQLVTESFGNPVNESSVIANTEGFNTFKTKAAALESPQINSMPIMDPSIQPDRDKEIKGFRYMGQRFTIDASIMQKLVYRDTDKNSKGEIRYLPKGLDVPAAMGSEEALNILKEMGETDYKKYPENMQKLREHLKTLSIGTWTQNLYWNWMHTLNTLVTDIPENAPIFMHNNAWARKQLNTYLGSWTELKHDTILYAKQVYAEMGGGPPEEKDDRGYVEPNTELYKRLGYLIGITDSELSDRNMLDVPTAEILARMKLLVNGLEQISVKELSGMELNEEDYELIRNFGGTIEHFWYEVNKEEMGDQSALSFLSDNPSSLVADVATDPNGQVLEEATGRVFDIYVIVPIDGKPRLASGSVYSYYEFPWPLNDRLTDKKWNELLDAGKAPELPEWTKSFIGKSLY